MLPGGDLLHGNAKRSGELDLGKSQLFAFRKNLFRSERFGLIVKVLSDDVADNLISRNFHADKPLQKWSTDVSQFSLPWGKCYLSPILDMATNEIITYDLSRSPNLQQVTDMLKRAFEKFPDTNGLIMHSDMGWQYQHDIYVKMLKDKGITQSMSRKGNCYDNCIIESFFGRMKTEMFYGHEKEYSSFENFSQAVKQYIDYYNNERIQKKTKWTPPAVYRVMST